MQIHLETLNPEAKTMEVTIRGDRRAVRVMIGAERIDIFGLAVRFATGTKVWPGTAIYWIESKQVNNLRPNIDKKGSVSLVGYAKDYAEKSVRSQHNSVR